MWPAQFRGMLLQNGNSFKDAQTVLIIGMSLRETSRLTEDLHEDLRSKEIYLLDPNHPTHVEPGQQSIPFNIHAVNGKVGDDLFSEINPGMFDVIIVDFSVVKFIDLTELALFANVFLKPSGHIFVRDLKVPFEEALPSAYSSTSTKKTVYIRYPNGHRESVNVQSDWTTRHYMHFLGLSHAYLLHYNGFRLEYDDNWNEKVKHQDEIKVMRQMMSKEYTVLKNIFEANQLKCNKIDTYPLSHRHSRVEQNTTAEVRCEFEHGVSQNAER